MHRAFEILTAINAACTAPSRLMPIGERPDVSSVVFTLADLEAEGNPAGPDNLQRSNWSLTVGADVYVYEPESTALAVLFDFVSKAHRAVMADESAGTYDGLPYVRGAHLGQMSEPEYDATAEQSFCYARHTFTVQYSANPADPET